MCWEGVAPFRANWNISLCCSEVHPGQLLTNTKGHKPLSGFLVLTDGSTGTGPEVWDLRGLQLDAMTGFSQSCVNVVLRYTQTADVVVEVTGWVVKLLGKTALQWKKSRNLQNYCFLTGILLMFHDRFIHIVLKMSRKDPLLCEKCILCSWITIWQCWLLRVFFQKCTFSS